MVKNLAISVPKSEQSIDEIDTFTHRSVTYQCSCGWEGAEFWSQNPSGVPLRLVLLLYFQKYNSHCRNQICQRQQKAQNMKETQIKYSLNISIPLVSLVIINNGLCNKLCLIKHLFVSYIEIIQTSDSI